jgi:hypothetical protein
MEAQRGSEYKQLSFLFQKKTKSISKCFNIYLLGINRSRYALRPEKWRRKQRSGKKTEVGSKRKTN